MRNIRSRAVGCTLYKGLLEFRRQDAGPCRSLRPACQRAKPLMQNASQMPSQCPPRHEIEEIADLAFYRRRTEMVLRRYLRMSLHVGRVPSCLPREALRARRSLRQPFGTFEDCVIFVHDIERCLKELDRLHAEVLTRIALQEYTQRETPNMLDVPQRSIGRCYDEALDILSAILLQRNLMEHDL